MVDMSTALGQDASSSAIQLGKALNDPIKGITALQRVGVSFDQQTKDRITLLVEQGETLQAQKIILGELNTEFGGSAAAAAKTFGGQLTVLHNRLNNLLGDLVGKAIPYLQRFVVWVGPRAHEALVRAKEAVADARIAWARFGEVLARHQPTIERVRSAIVLLSKVIVPLIKWNILLYSTIFRVWMKILDVILTVTDKLIAAFRRIAGPAHAAFAAVAAAVRIAISPILTMINAVKTLISWINAIPDVIPGRSSNAGVPTGRPEHRAMGGPVSRLRPYLVGERGPELFVPRSSGRVVANGAGGGSVNVIVLGGDREAIDYLRRLDIRQSRRSGRGLL
jgi:hypothetical protein